MSAESEIKPPKWAIWLAKRCIRSEFQEEILGDLEEVFADDLAAGSSSRAKRRFVLETIKLLKPNLLKNIKWIFQFTTMLQNHFKVAYRSLLRFKVHTAVNLIGLALGLAIAGLMFYYIADERSFDKFHQKGDRIYKIVSHSDKGGTMETNAWPVAYSLKTQYPEVEAIVYAKEASGSFKLNHNNKRFDHDIHFASEDFFELFSFHMLEGNPKTALTKPYAIVITEDIKNQYFVGSALGEVITLRDSINFQITGIVANPPRDSHIQFDMLISFSTYEKVSGWFSYTEGWGNFNVRNYLLLRDGANLSELENKASSLYMDNVGDLFTEMGINFKVGLIPLKDIYLNSGLYNGFGPHGSKDRIRTVSLIAVFILLLACVNYTNLSTARSIYRAKEVGIRKVAGSTRGNLTVQFLIESLLITSLSFVLALVLIQLGLPFFNEILEKSYSLWSLFSLKTITTAIGLILFTSLLAGLYPAIYISGMRPLKALMSKSQKSGGIPLRKVLIVFQFFIASAVILFTFLVMDQIRFMQNQNLGFNKDKILIIDASNVPGATKKASFKNELKGIPNVKNASFNNALPGRPGWQGQWAYAEKVSEDHVTTEYMAIDEDYLNTLNLQLIAGRNFELDRPSELEEGLIINETCVTAMGWNSPEVAIGKRIVSPSGRPEGKVIGVVKDYHGLGLQNPIWPKAMDYSSSSYGRYFAIQFGSENTTELITQLENKWTQLFPDYPMEYSFLDVDFDRQYKKERQLASLLGVFTAMIIVISSIGLLGLISFVALSKTKEIGIRKTLGATIHQIILLLSKDFMVLVLVGNVLAIPMIWHIGNSWLDNFAYATQIDTFNFILTAVVTLMISFITVSLQTFKTAAMNPSKSLRYE